MFVNLIIEYIFAPALRNKYCSKQQVLFFLKKFLKKVLRVKKIVLHLHPLSERATFGNIDERYF